MKNQSPQLPRISRFIIPILWGAPLIIMAVLVTACGKISNSVFSSSIDEGVIEYHVSFPELDDESLTATLLPETMIYAFTKDAFASHFEAAGGVFKNRIIASHKDRTVEHQLKIFRKKIKVMMDESDVMKMIADYPKMNVIKTEDTDTIAGFHCNKALVVFEDVEIPEIEVFYTTDIQMESPNWCTLYHEIEGVLMAYEIEEFGIRMRLEAKSVEPKKLDPELLNPEEEFQAVSKESMDVELAQLVETFEL